MAWKLKQIFVVVVGAFLVWACAQLRPGFENQNSTSSRHPASVTTFQTVIPSNLDRPTDMVMELSYDNRFVVAEVYKALYQINQGLTQPIQFRLLYPNTAFSPIGGGGTMDGMNTQKEIENLKERLRAEIGNENALRFFSAHPHDYLIYAWVQDLGEPTWIYEEKWKPSFLYFNPKNGEVPQNPWPVHIDGIVEKDLPYENAYFSYAALEKIFSFSHAQGFPALEFKGNLKPSNQGGNFEVLPDGTPFMGSSASDELVEFVKKATGKTPLILDTEGMIVGHVDEMFAFIPSSKSTCGYALVAADPLWGDYLQKDEILTSMGTDESFKESLTYFLKPNQALDFVPSEKYDKFDLMKKIRKHKQGDFKDYPRMIDWIVLKSLLGKKRVEENIVKIKDQLRLSCSNLQVIRVPVLTAYNSQADYSQDMPENIEKSYYFFRNPTPNMVVLGDHLIISEFINDRFKKATMDKFKTEGIDESRIHLVNAGYYHNEMGSVHCGSLVFRKPKAVEN